MKLKTECQKHGWDDREADRLILIRNEDPPKIAGTGSSDMDVVVFVRHGDHFDVWTDGTKSHLGLVGDVGAFLRQKQRKGHNGHDGPGRISPDWDSEL